MTPPLVIRQAFSTPPSDAYCRLIDSWFFMITFGKASVLTVTCLSIDRWFAVVRPIQYKCTFTKKRLCVYLTIVWVLSSLATCYVIFEGKAVGDKCVLEPLSENSAGRLSVIFLQAALTVYIPTLITWIAFLHIWKTAKLSAELRGTGDDLAMKRLLRMCASVALLMTLCWIPEQVTYTMQEFGLVEYTTRRLSTGLAILNSALNPWVYCLTNRKYRAEIKRLFPFCKKRTYHVSSRAIEHPVQMTTPKRQGNKTTSK